MLKILPLGDAPWDGTKKGRLERSGLVKTKIILYAYCRLGSYNRVERAKRRGNISFSSPVVFPFFAVNKEAVFV